MLRRSLSYMLTGLLIAVPILLTVGRALPSSRSSADAKHDGHCPSSRRVTPVTHSPFVLAPYFRSSSS